MLQLQVKACSLIALAMIWPLDYVNLQYRKFLHERAARSVLDTPVISPRDDGLVLFSMVGTRVLCSYLVAIKSLYHCLQAGRIVILNDGTLTPQDRAVLAHHCGGPRIIDIEDVDTGPCPRGGTWERLLSILDLRRECYVIQLDSDTVTLGPIEEVRACIKANRSFTIRGEQGAEIVSPEEISHFQKGNSTTHVQTVIEARMNQLDMADTQGLKYVRGCSGFTGFAREASGRKLAEEFSQAAQSLLGRDKWSEWGSEQVTSNFVTANSTDPLLLPYDRYMNFWDEGIPKDARLVHFIGTYRYHGGEYTQACRRAIAALNSRQ